MRDILPPDFESEDNIIALYDLSRWKLYNYKLLSMAISLLKAFHKNISIHTRMREKGSILDNVKQIVLSYEYLLESGLIEYMKYLRIRGIKIRMAKVATLRDYDYQRDIEFAKEAGYQITFYAPDKVKSSWFQTLHLNLKKIYHGTQFISEGNSKVYLMPDNRLYEDYPASKLYTERQGLL